MNVEKNISLNIDQDNIDKRLDVYLFENFKDYSRTFFKSLILDKLVYVNGKLIGKPSYLTRLYDKIEFSFNNNQELIININNSIIDNLDVKVLYTHEDFLIVYKPAYLNTHRPNLNNKDVALTDWLINHFQELVRVGPIERPGIVHRLDKDTSGLLIIARNICSHIVFSDMFKNRKIEKTYIAVTKGHAQMDGEINLKIKRHNIIRTKMTTNSVIGRDSITRYKVIRYLKDSSILEVSPYTGRTHQIRVHLSAINNAIIGDGVYGSKSEFIGRQALHAYKLSFFYKNKYYMFLHDIPTDMKELISNLE